MTAPPARRLNELPPRITRHLSSADHHRVPRLYTLVRDAIRNKDLPPGHTLHYADLANLLSPRGGRHTVSGALWLLRKDGLVETRPRYGTRVRVAGQEWTQTDDGIPHAVHVEMALRERLAEQTYPAGTRFPGLYELADEFGVSDKTIREALKPLVAAGYLATSSYRKAGTQVTDVVTRTPRDVLLRPADRPALPRGTTFTLWGKTQTLPEWSRDSRCKVGYPLLKARVRTERWPLERALTTPVRRRTARSPGNPPIT